jgi:hypothetical protein
MKIARESIYIAIIGLADLVTTMLWVRYHGASEGNPVFAQYLRMGFAWFVLVKLIMLACPLFLLEFARRRRPRFTLRASRFAIGAYCGLYLVGFLHLNPNAIHPTAAEAAVPPAIARSEQNRRHDSAHKRDRKPAIPSKIDSSAQLASAR